jgi:uncharacterized protein YjbI with pentapeptide repeats
MNELRFAMDRDETVALFLQGKEAWNAWAEQMLAERKAMEADGRWRLEKDDFGNLKPLNYETGKWIMVATVADFSNCQFVERGVKGSEETEGTERTEGEDGSVRRPFKKTVLCDKERVDFGYFIFPGAVNFNGAVFTGYTDFGSVVFTGSTGFLRATFKHIANFSNATFGGDSGVQNATFEDNADFRHTGFAGNARFTRSTFSGDAEFRNARFEAESRFDSVHFLEIARYDPVRFAGTARFDSSTFSRTTRFTGANFGGSTNFEGVKVERGFDFSGATFAKVPALSQSDFKQAPDLDSVSFPIPSFWGRGDAKLVPQYRAIRRMAIQGADYEREQMAYKGELRSRRWTVDKWGPALWLGIFYDGVADCGRSILRPLAIWFASIAVFAAIYLRLSDGWTCGAPFIKALFLSGRNALVLFNGARDARIAQAYQCLFGGNPEPDIPDSVSFLESFVQVPLSATLIFLFLLAVKNRFKIK